MAGESNLQKLMRKEFERLRNGGSNHLALDEVLRVKLPAVMGVELAHMGVLYTLDSDHDGRFTLPELFEFASLLMSFQRICQPHELQQMFRAYCTLRLWKRLSAPDGTSAFVEWAKSLLLGIGEVEQHEDYPGVTFLSRDSIQTLHEVMNVGASREMDFQAFFDLLQRAAEEEGLMDLMNEQLDEVVPLPVAEAFLKFSANSFGECMPRMHFDPDLADFVEAKLLASEKKL